MIVESVQVDGKPRQRHLACLGEITESAIQIPAQRAFFWQAAVLQLDRLAVLNDDRARIERAIAEKVPLLTRKEYDAWIAGRTALEKDWGEFAGPVPDFAICGVRRCPRRRLFETLDVVREIPDIRSIE